MKNKLKNQTVLAPLTLISLLVMTLSGCVHHADTSLESSHEDIRAYENTLALASKGSNAAELQDMPEELRSVQNLRDGTFLSITTKEIVISQGASRVEVQPALVSPLNDLDLIIRANWLLERKGISIRLRNSGTSFLVKNMCLGVTNGEVAFTDCKFQADSENLQMRPLDNGAVLLTASGGGTGGQFQCLGATPNQKDVGKLELTLAPCSLNTAVSPRFQWVITSSQTPTTTKLLPAQPARP